MEVDDNNKNGNENSLMSDIIVTNKQKEMEKFVVEWLQELVEEITNHKLQTKKITRRKKRPKIGEVIANIKNATKEEKEEAEGVKIIGKEEAMNFYQLKAIYQHDRTSCGYYALYFAKQILQSLISSKNSIDWMGKRGGFYREKFHWQKMLKAKATAEGNKYYPWNFSSIESQVMERDYLHFLLQNDDQIRQLGGPIVISAISEMYRECLQKGFLSVDKIIQLQEIFEKFQSEDTFTHAFIIGSYSHWVLIVLHKTTNHQIDHKNKSKEEKVNYEGIFIDSFNLPIISISLDQIADKVLENLRKRKKSEEEIPLVVGKKMRGVESILFAISLCFDCSRGVRNFIEENLLLQCDFLLSDFESFLSLRHQTSPPSLPNDQKIVNNNNNRKRRKIRADRPVDFDIDLNEDHKERIEEWFRLDYHPSILFDLFDNLLYLKRFAHNFRASKSERMQQLFLWQRKLCKLSKKNFTNYPLLCRFSRVVAPKIRKLVK